MGNALCCVGAKARAPKPADGVTRLTDEGISHYVELPPDTFFLESCASDERYAPGKIFVPIQRDKDARQCYIYEFDKTSTEASLKYGPLRLRGEEPTALTCFGCALTGDGRMWLCIWNRNLVICVDLDTGDVIEEVRILAPNDVCVDPNDDNIVYVAGGGEFCRVCSCITDPSRGSIWRITVQPRGGVPMLVHIGEGATTLAGIQMMGGEIYAAQLYNVFKTSTVKAMCCLRRLVVWEGLDEQDQVWLADNLKPFDADTLVVPAYGAATRARAWVWGLRVLPAVLNCMAQVVTCAMQGEVCHEALSDPEVSLEFSANDSTDPLRIILLQADGDARHYEVALTEAHTRESTTERKYFFDTNVTGVAHVEDKLVCINFQQPRILLLDDAHFKEAGGPDLKVT